MADSEPMPLTLVWVALVTVPVMVAAAALAVRRVEAWLAARDARVGPARTMAERPPGGTDV